MKSILMAFPPLPFRICSQVIPGTQYDIHFTNIKLSLCGRPCLSCEKGSRAYKETESLPSKELTFQKGRCHVYKALEFSAKDVQLQELWEFRKSRSLVTVRMYYPGVSPCLWGLPGRSFVLAGAQKPLCADNTSTDGFSCKYLLSH